MSDQPASAATRLISAPQFSRMASLSVPTIHRLDGTDGFPKSVRLTEQRKAWLLEEVSQWIAAKVQKRDQALARQA